jgi:hypothetical protein
MSYHACVTLYVTLLDISFVIGCAPILCQPSVCIFSDDNSQIIVRQTYTFYWWLMQCLERKRN